jgi:hypothetical protein
MGEAHPVRFRVSLFSLLLVGGLRETLGCGNDEHDPSGFKVPEHFREPEILSRDNSGWLFWVIRLIGAHLFWFRLSTGVVRREVSPPSELLGGHPSLRLPVFLPVVNVAHPESRAHITVI